MNTPADGGVPAPGEPTAADEPAHPPVRWGIGDVGLGLAYVAAFAAAGLALAVILQAIVGGADSGEADVLEIGIPTWAALQLGLGSWPFVVSRWKGAGPVLDWRLKFRPVDVPLGIGTAVIAVGVGGVMAAIVAALVGLDQDDVVSNTQSLEEARGTPWVYLLVLFVVIIGPACEELFFRGITLRTLERRFGAGLAVVGSTVLFTAAHYGGGGPAQTAVLLTVIGVVGAALAVVTIQVGRLWPAIFAHMLFNGLAAAQALGLFDGAA